MKNLFIAMLIICFSFGIAFTAQNKIRIIDQRIIAHGNGYKTAVTLVCINGYQFVITSNGRSGGQSTVQVYASVVPARCNCE